MKKILFLIDTLETGGAEKSLLDICSNLNEFEPVFIQLFKGGELKKKYEDNAIKVISLEEEPSYNFYAIANKVLPYVKDINPHIIHSTLFRADMVARILARKNKIPLINSLVNNSYSKIRYNGLTTFGKIKLYSVQALDRLTAANVDLFISNSETIKKSNSKALNIPLRKIKVIYRGRQFEKFQDVSKPRIEELRQSLSLENDLLFLNVSRLLSRKGQLDLIKAFGMLLLETKCRAKLFIAGEGSYRNRLEEEINNLNLNEKVILLGNRQDIPDLLNLANFFVYPSYYEGLPGALIEAIISKKPIIASDIPENLECVKSSNAIFYERGNVEKLYKALKLALAEEDWEDKTEGAYRYALYNFSLSKVVSQYEENYMQLI